MKHLSTLFTVVLLTMFSVQVWGATTFTSSYIKYEVTDATNLKVKVTGTSSSTLTTISIPETVTYSNKTYTINEIGASAFKNNTKITSVTLTWRVTKIGRSAFEGCTAITSFTLGTSTGSRTIAPCAFKGCTGLTSLSISPSFGVIGDSAFYGCNKVATIQFTKYTDGSASQLRSIGKYAFYNCSKVTTVVWNYPVASWFNIEFANSSSNPVYYAKGLNEVKSGAAGYTKVTDLTVPDDVKAINPFAFYNDTLLTSITVGTGIKTIGASAFSGCTKVTTVTFNAAPDTIGSSAFSSLGSSSKSTSKVVKFNGSANDWAGIEFNGYASNPVYYIKRLQTKEGSATSYTNLEHVSFTAKVIKPNAFYNDTLLKSITFPSTLTSVGNSAFYGCKNVGVVISKRSVSATSTLPVAGSSTFTNIPTTTPLIVPTEASIDYYKSATGWNKFSAHTSTTMDFPCGDNAVGSLSYLGSLTISGTGAMFDYASTKSPWYDYRTLITSITINYGITHVGNYAFQNCSNALSAYLRVGVESVGTSAFSGCSSLTTVGIYGSTNSTLTSAQDWAKIDFANYLANPIYHAKSLSTMQQQSSYPAFGKVSIIDLSQANKVGDYAFYNLESATALTLGEDITKIGASAFCNCKGLTYVKALSGVAPTLGNTSVWTNVKATAALWSPCGADYSSWAFTTNYVLYPSLAEYEGGYVSSTTSHTTKTVTLTARSDQFHTFSQWSDGNTDNPRSIVGPTECVSPVFASIDCSTSVSDTWNFSENLTTFGSTASQIPACWWNGHTITSDTYSDSQSPYCATNGTTIYAHGSEESTNKALQFFNNSTTANAYVILPEINGLVAHKRLHFYGRAAKFYKSTHSTTASQNQLTEANNNYVRTLYIGYVTDPEDISTFTKLDEVTYDYVWDNKTGVYCTNDETGNKYWQEYSIDMANYVGKGQICILMPGNGKASYFYIDDMSFEGPDAITLVDNASNEDILTEFNDETVNVTVARTFYNDGYNTLCLPFAVEATKVQDVFGEGTKLYTLTGSTYENEQYEFVFGETDAIAAGTPYLLAPKNEVTSPVFNGVTIDKDANTTTTTTYVNFVGSFNPVINILVDETFLFLGGDGKSLYYTDEPDTTLKGLRCYWQLKSGAISAPARIVIGGHISTGTTINRDSQPATKQLRNGQLIIQHNGRTYNAHGTQLN